MLVALALPALNLHTAISGLDGPEVPGRMQAFNRVDEAFPGGATPAVVAIAGDASDPELQAAVTELRTRALESGKALQPITVDTAPRSGHVQVEIPLVGKGTDDVSNDALATLRG